MDYVQHLLFPAYTLMFMEFQAIILSTLSPPVFSGATDARRSLSPLGFHPTPLTKAGSHRFLSSSRQSTFHLLLRLPWFGPSPQVRSFFQEAPPPGAMASADFLQFSYTLRHRFLYDRTVRQSPYKVFARPPRARASSLRPMQPPHVHYRVRAASDFTLSCKLVRPVRGPSV
jgi:hypothetical protein